MQIGLPTLLITKAPMLPCVSWLQLSLLVIHVSQSNVESYYCALAFVVAKIVWTQSFFKEPWIPQSTTLWFGVIIRVILV